MEKMTTYPTSVHHKTKTNLYPHLVIKNNVHPDSLFAFPFVGIAIKFILSLPAIIFLIFLAIAFVVLWFINPFVILFTGKYWNAAYEITVGYMIYKIKLALFLMGLTDHYPGFNLETNGIFEFDMPKPEAPSRLMAFPFGGAVGRAILLIPYSIYRTVLGYGAIAATIGSWFGILVKGKYPESLYEFNRDALRVSLGYTAYLAYMSDRYPSFGISMRHTPIKITLIIIGAILFLISLSDTPTRQPRMAEVPCDPSLHTPHCYAPVSNDRSLF